jgi:hypothetical protein
MSATKPYQAGEAIEDYCRACKTDRMHTVVAVDANRRPVRVMCGYCRSEHNYRGGPRVDVDGSTSLPSTSLPSTPLRAGGSPASRRPDAPATSRADPRDARDPRDAPAAREAAPRRAPVDRTPFPLVSERERTVPQMALSSDVDLELLLRRIIREETGLTPVPPADKWRGGSLVLRPGTPGLQEKSWPVETFFHKIVMIRNRLRTLEQVVNASPLADDEKVKIQGYISGCYGSLTSFNVLFSEEEDQFKGAAES